MLNTEIDLPMDISSRLEKFFEVECIDREKWFKKAFLNGIETLLRKWAYLEKRRQEILKRQQGNKS